MRNRRLGWERDGVVRGGLRGGFVPNFTPRWLNPYAWYDAHLGGSATQITDSSANARAVITNGAGSNAALWLPYTTPSLYLPGTSDYELTSGSPVGFTTGTFTVILKQPAGVNTTGWAGAGSGFGLYLGDENYTSGGVAFLSYDGAAYFYAGIGGARQVAATGISDIAGVRNASYVKIEIQPNVSGNLVGSLYTSADGVSYALNTTVTTAGVGGTVGASATIFRLLGCGALSGSSQYTVHEMSVFINGTLVRKFDAALSGQTGYTDSFGTVWGITRPASGRKAVVQSPAAGSARGLFLLGTDDYLTGPNAAIPPMNVANAATLVAVTRVFGYPANGTVFDTRDGTTVGVALYTPLANTYEFYIKNIGGTGTVTVASGLRAVTASTLAGRTATGASLTANGGSPVYRDVTAVGDMTAPSTFKIGQDLALSAPHDMEFEAFLTFNRSLTAGEVAQLVSYYGGGR